jgi:hypothetical protein
MEVHISKFLQSIIALKLHFVSDIPLFQSHDLEALDRLLVKRTNLHPCIIEMFCHKKRELNK